MLRIALDHFVEALVDGHEALPDVLVGERHQHRRPADRIALGIQQAAQWMRSDRDGQLAESHLAQPAGAEDAVLLAAGTRLQLVDVVQQGGDLDEADVDRNAGLAHQPGCLGGDATDALGMDHDPGG
jgi:hypothetical protein